MSATAADVRNGLKTRKVIARKNPSDLTVSLAGHRFVEEASHLGMLRQIAPRASGCNLVDGHFTGVHRVPEQLKALPTDGITDPADKRSQRLRVIGAEQPRHRRMRVLVATAVEDAVGS